MEKKIEAEENEKEEDRNNNRTCKKSLTHTLKITNQAQALGTRT